jgi:cell division inhibitor SepF
VVGEKKSFLDKVLRFLGIEEEEAAAVEELQESLPQPKESSDEDGKSRIKVTVMSPASYDDVQSVADHLIKEQPVIVSLEKLDRETAKRILDFLAGTMYAMDGSYQRLNERLFLFSPKNVEVDGKFYSIYEDNAE